MSERILRIAKEQSAIDCACSPEDFDKTESVFVRSEKRSTARKYLNLPFFCQLVTYGNNVVASVRNGEIEKIVRDYCGKYSAEHCFETPALHELDAALAPFGARSRNMAEYFLPKSEKIEIPFCPYPVKILTKEDFSALYLPQWSNALCGKRAEDDALCAAAYDGEQIVGLAGASADCESMWQIGIDVLPAYRRRGIAAALTSRLAREVFLRGKIPFYCAAWSNIKSVRNALKCGFYPAWAELTCFERELI